MSEHAWKTTSLTEELSSRVDPDQERGGFVLRDGTVVELANTAEDPKNNFRPADTELLEVIDLDIAAMWHTHPEGTANLSVEDWNAFLSWPEIQFIIAAPGEVRFYGVKGRAVVNLPGVETTS